MSRQIVVSGGAGFWCGADGLALDAHALSLTGKRRPKVCYLATAAGDSDEFIQGFYDSLGPMCAPSHLPLFLPPFRSPVEALADQDLIYVSGGNTANMLAVWRVHGIDRMLNDALRNGTILYGSSAGGLCWFESGITNSLGFDDTLRPFHDALGYLRGSHCPHFDREGRRPTFLQMIEQGVLDGGLGIDELAAVHFIDGHVYETFASTSDAGAHLIAKSDTGGPTLTSLPVTLI